MIVCNPRGERGGSTGGVWSLFPKKDSDASEPYTAGISDAMSKLPDDEKSSKKISGSSGLADGGFNSGLVGVKDTGKNE